MITKQVWDTKANKLINLEFDPKKYPTDESVNVWIANQRQYVLPRQEGEEVSPIPTALRYGSMVGGAPGMAAGEFVAREFEQFKDVGDLPKLVTPEDPYNTGLFELDEDIRRHMENLGAGVAIGVGAKIAQETIGRAISATYRKVAPKILEPLGKGIQRAGEKGGAAVQRTQELLRRYTLSPKYPGTYSLSLGQLTRHVGGFLDLLEGTAQGAIGAGRKMAEAAWRNKKVLSDAADDLFRGLTKEVDGETYGNIAYRYFTQEESLATLHARYLYNRARGLANLEGRTVNYTRFREYLQKSQTDTAKSLLNALDSELVDKQLATRTSKGLQFAGRGRSGYDPWANVDPDTSIEIRRIVNDVINSTRKKADKRAVAKIADDYIRPELKRGFGGDDAGRFLQMADEFQGVLRNTFGEIQTGALRKQFAADPSEVYKVFISQKNRLARLKAFEEIYLGGAKWRQRGVGGNWGKEAFEEEILKPLRHKLFSEAFDKEAGIWSGERLIQVLESQDKAYLRKVLGSDDIVKGLTEVGHALEIAERAGPSGGAKMAIRLIQGGAIVSAAMGGMYANKPSVSVGGTTLIFLTPYVLAHGLTNPNFVRMLTDGVHYGAGSTQFTRLIARITVLEREAIKDWAKETALAKKLYSSFTLPTIEERKETPISPDELWFGVGP